MRYAALFALIQAIFGLVCAELLDDYVNQGPDFIKFDLLPEYDYSGESEFGSWNGKAVNLTSQVWLNSDDWGADWGGEDAQWWHIMYIITPNVIKTPGWRNLYITGGNNNNPIPSATSEDIGICSLLAMQTGQIFVVLFQVPNYPIYIKSEDNPSNLGEDDLLAHTFVHYMDYIKNDGSDKSLPDASWVVILPMVKAAFASMAAAEVIIGDEALPSWIVFGASKRGWTTWLVGAVDSVREKSQQRIKAICPLVLDGLNFPRFLHHHFNSYGGWSFTMRAFWDVGFTGRIDSDEIIPLWTLIDPITYKARFKGMPKLVLDGVGDEWFVLDDSRYWIKDMLENGPVLLGMFPDAEHSLATAIPSMVPILGSYASSIANSKILPTFTWSIDYEASSITVLMDSSAKGFNRTVQIWSSSTCHGDAPRRDFRMVNMDLKAQGKCSCGLPLGDENCLNLRTGFWDSFTLDADLSLDPAGNTYVAMHTVPLRSLQQWDAFYVTVTFHNVSPELILNGSLPQKGDCQRHPLDRSRCLPSVEVGDLQLSTQVVIVPDYEPFSCYGEQCQGELL